MWPGSPTIRHATFDLGLMAVLGGGGGTIAGNFGRER